MALFQSARVTGATLNFGSSEVARASIGQFSEQAVGDEVTDAYRSDYEKVRAGEPGYELISNVVQSSGMSYTVTSSDIQKFQTSINLLKDVFNADVKFDDSAGATVRWEVPGSQKLVIGTTKAPSNVLPSIPPKTPPRKVELPQPTPFLNFPSVRNTDRYSPNFSIEPRAGKTNVRIEIAGENAGAVKLNLRKDVKNWGDKTLFKNLSNGSRIPAAQHAGVFWHVKGVPAGKSVAISLFYE